MALWTPDNLDPALSKRLWVDAQAAGAWTLGSGGVIDQATDKSGLGNHLTPATATKPTFSETAKNGLPGIVFANVADALITPAMAQSDGATGVYVLLVASKEADPVNYSVPFCMGANNTQWQLIWANYTSGIPVADQGKSYWRNSLSGGGDAVSAGGIVVTGDTMLWTGTQANAEFDQRFNGNLMGTRGTGTRNFGASTALTIGSTPATNYSTHQLQGVLQEFLLIYGIPTQEDKDRLLGYAAHRWGLESQLPGDHPYKNAPPYSFAGRIYGTVRDKNGALAARHVRLIQESTQQCVAEIDSHPVTGEFEFSDSLAEEPYTLVFSGESDRNAIVFSGVVPEATE